MSFAKKLYAAIKENNIEKGKELLANPDFRPSKHQNWAIIEAVQNNKYDFVELLLKDGRISPANYKNLAIRSSLTLEYKNSQKNKKTKSIFELLNNDPRTDLSDHNNSGFHYVCKVGFTRLVKLFLNDPKVNPASRNSWSVKIATQNKHIEVIKLLLNDQRADPSDIKSEFHSDTHLPLFNSLSLNDDYEIFQKLLSYNLDIHSYNFVFLQTIIKGHNKAFDLLLNFNFINSEQNDFINIAIEYSNFYALKKLIKLEKFHTEKRKGLNNAAKSNVDIFNFVLEHDYFAEITKESMPIVYACTSDNIDLLNVLLKKHDLNYTFYPSIISTAIDCELSNILNVLKNNQYAKKWLLKENLSDEQFKKLNKIMLLNNIVNF